MFVVGTLSTNPCCHSLSCPPEKGKREERRGERSAGKKREEKKGEEEEWLLNMYVGPVCGLTRVAAMYGGGEGLLRGFPTPSPPTLTYPFGK